MSAARKLASRSRGRFYGGRYRGGRTGNWQIALIVGFGIVGTVSLFYILKKLSCGKIPNRRSLFMYTVYIFIWTLFLCTPAIVILSLNPTLAVGILAIVSLCLLILPLLLWLIIAVRKSRHFANKGDFRGTMNPDPEQAYANNIRVDEQQYPQYNFLPQASTATTYSTVFDADQKAHFPGHTKPNAQV